MHRITREHIVYSLDEKHPPVLNINPGETVIFETHDARTGTIQTENDQITIGGTGGSQCHLKRLLEVAGITASLKPIKSQWNS